MSAGTMVKRVAAALAAAKGVQIVDEVDEAMFERDARAAIEAMRKPSPEMLAAAWKVFRPKAGASIQPGPAFREALTAMMDAALESQTP